MSELKNKIDALSKEITDKLSQANTIKEIESIRTTFLGKNGKVGELLEKFKTLSVEEKKEIGPHLQKLKTSLEDNINTAKNTLLTKQTEQENLKKQNFDVSAYLPQSCKGHLHPYSQFIEEIQDIFLSMGYEILETPELETDEYNFTALNIPADHPARDTQDTFWVNYEKLLMRTQTSTTQVHAMKTKPLPLAIVAPGRTYRHEATDVSHDFMFMQCEGCFINKDVSLAHLFGTAQTFLKKLFKKNTLDIRIRPGFFPFVEPGVEIDMRCPFCKSGCSVCKKSTWIEVFPGGLIHPNVLKHCGIDPNIYSGFAFGFGLTRLVMLKYNIDDVRLLLSGKVKFLEQF